MIVEIFLYYCRICVILSKKVLNISNKMYNIAVEKWLLIKKKFLFSLLLSYEKGII